MYYSEKLRNEYARRYARLTFSDSFMFSRVIKVILADDIPEIMTIEAEKVIKVNAGKHGVRYDIRIKTKTGECIYNVEMQQKDEKNTPKRSRYYQSTSDAEYLRQGFGL